LLSRIRENPSDAFSDRFLSTSASPVNLSRSVWKSVTISSGLIFLRCGPTSSMDSGCISTALSRSTSASRSYVFVVPALCITL
jgi:hypothetical protein